MDASQDIEEIKFLPATPEIVPGSSSLSNFETHFTEAKTLWLNSTHASQLQQLLSRIISDRVQDPIQNVVCLAIGDIDPRSLAQMIVFFQIVASLAEANPDILNNIAVQDPWLHEEDNKDMKAMFERHGCRVVAHPAAFDLVGPHTFLMAPFIPLADLMHDLRGKNAIDLPLYIGSDLKNFVETREKLWIPADDVAWYHELACTMVDERLCSYEGMPSPRPSMQNDYSPLGQALHYLGIWWRPARDEEQRADDKVMACLGSASKLGFDEGKVVFGRGYGAGFKDLTRRKQDEIVRSYLTTRLPISPMFRTLASSKLARLGEKGTWVDHVINYMKTMPEKEKEALRKIKEFKAEDGGIGEGP